MTEHLAYNLSDYVLGALDILMKGEYSFYTQEDLDMWLEMFHDSVQVQEEEVPRRDRG